VYRVVAVVARSSGLYGGVVQIIHEPGPLRGETVSLIKYRKIVSAEAEFFHLNTVPNFNVHSTFLCPCIANIFAEYNQQDVTFHNLM